MTVTQPQSPQQLLVAFLADEESAVVWSTDRELRISQIAGGVLPGLGIDNPEAVVGEAAVSVFDQEDDADSELLVAHQSALAGELATCYFQWRGWRFHGRVTACLDDRGTIVGCLGVACLHVAIDGLEEALDASERRFETLVGMSPAGIYMTDEAGRCTYVNRRWCEIASVRAIDALGHSWEHTIHPDDRVRVTSHWRQAMESGGVWEHTFRLLSPEGGVTWVLGQARPLRNADDRVTGYAGIIIDITAQKKADRKLRESEKRFARLLSAVTSYRYCVLLSEGVPVATEHSNSCLGTTGYLPEDYAQDPFLWINMVHSEDRQVVLEHVNKVLKGQPVPPVEHRIYHKKGRVVWVRDTIIPHYTTSGNLVRYDGLVEDITDRKRIDRRLWQILESAPDAMVITDQKGTILLANGQTHRMFGYPSQELVNQPVEMLIPERFRAAHVAHRTAYFNAPDLRVMTNRPALYGRRKDGSEFAAEISLSPIEMDDEMLVCAGIRDISRRKEAENARRVNLQIQSTMASLLELSLQPIGLAEKMERSLGLLFTVPWIELESRGAIFLVRQGSHDLTMVAHRGMPEAIQRRCANVAVGQCLCGRAAQECQIIFADQLDVRRARDFPGICEHGIYCVPIMSGQTLLGVLNLCVGPSQGRSEEEEHFLQAVAHVLAGVITRSRSEELLRSSEERFGLAVRGTDAGIWDWNLLTNEVYFSPRWKGMLGFTSDEIGDDFSEWETRIHPEDRERSLATMKAYLAGQTQHYELEHRLEHRDGTYRWILARGAMVQGPDGLPCRMVGSHLDITDRKLAEEQLRYRESQLFAAQRIQEHLLPSSALNLPGFDIAGRVVPAQFAGGDYFDYLPLSDGTLAVVVGDVSGHDVSAALVMASVSAHLRSFAEDHARIQDIIEHTNSILMRETDDGRFVTLFVLQLDVVQRSVRYVNAGHPHGYLLGAGGELKAVLRSRSFPLAVVPEAEYPVSESFALESGDIVLLVTDGILETRSPEGDSFDGQRLLEVVRQHQRRPAEVIIGAIHQAVFQFAGLPHAHDDLTVVILKVE